MRLKPLFICICCILEREGDKGAMDVNRLKISIYSFLWIFFYIAIIVLNTYVSMLFQNPIYFVITLFITTFITVGPLLFSIQYLVSKYKDKEEIKHEDFFIPFEIYFTNRYRDIYKVENHMIVTYLLIGVLFVVIEMFFVIFDPEISIEHLFFDLIGTEHFCKNDLEFILLEIASYIGVCYFLIINYTKITTCQAVLSSDTPVEIARYVISKINKRYKKERIRLILRKGIPFLFVYSLGYFGGLFFGLRNSLCIYVTISVSICFSLLICYPFIFDIMKLKINLFYKHKKEFQTIAELYKKCYDKITE